MNGDKLFHLLEKKRGFFEAILELCREESELEHTEYRALLEHKQLLLRYVEEIDRELKSFQACYHTLSECVQKEMHHINHLIEKILEVDQLNANERKKKLMVMERYDNKR